MPTPSKRAHLPQPLRLNTDGDDEQAVQGDRRGHMEGAHGESCQYALILLHPHPALPSRIPVSIPSTHAPPRTLTSAPAPHTIYN